MNSCNVDGCLAATMVSVTHIPLLLLSQPPKKMYPLQHASLFVQMYLVLMELSIGQTFKLFLTGPSQNSIKKRAKVVPPLHILWHMATQTSACYAI